jgi:transaldolase/glucose-6-phosphate isomerase
MNPLQQLGALGQSVWLDSIRRSLVIGGELQRMIAEDGLTGVTSNPAIFEKAIAASVDYREAIAGLAGDSGLDGKALYERLAIADIRSAADLLEPVYRRTSGRDGYVSLEVSPLLARDTAGTVTEARRLWREVDKPNVMIKVPATPEGIPAIETLIAEGINVNVTLLFSCSAYERVAEAFIRGLERRRRDGGPIENVASVASVFVSRIDSAVDALLDARIATATGGAEHERLRALKGKTAIANAKLAYQRYREVFSGARWEALAEHGARSQRLLWASTGAKDPAFRDVVYVEELIGPDTVNTIPPATFEAFRDHGRVRASLEEDVAAAHAVLANLPGAGIDLDAVTGRLLEQGLRLFEEAFDRLLCVVEATRTANHLGLASRQMVHLPAALQGEVDSVLASWRESGTMRRLWARDASLWTSSGEQSWMGWLGITEDQRAHFDRFRALADEVRAEGFTHALVLGMGGSSLCPDVLRATFGRQQGFPELVVLDSTDPAQVRACESSVDLARTLFVVSSKSGTTLEPYIFMRTFYERVRDLLGDAEAPRRFIAITDPGSKLEQEARSLGFRHVFHGVPSIGGRYSALSDFGMVPAALAGLDVALLLERADEIAHACAACVPADDNPGVVLGVVLGVLGQYGRNKVTFVTSPRIGTLGDWLEQLLAESTGKQGKALIPLADERLGPPEAYGDDRVFVYLGVAGDDDGTQQTALVRLKQSGHPVVRIALTDTYDLGHEFFRWEIATAVAGSILGINPFDQPDVEASKLATRRLTDEYERAGALPAETPLLTEGGIALFADPVNAEALSGRAGQQATLVELLRAHLARLGAGDYFALLAYVEMNEAHREALQAIRHEVRDRRGVATCLGFGPRFLHSTGQAYKGGPNSGVFVQVTCDDAEDLPIPGQTYTFGVVKAAQARGDLEVLADRGRRVVRLHLGADVAAGLSRVQKLVSEVLR